MATSWINPRIISQYPEEGAETLHVKWDDTNGFSNLKSANSQSVGTMGDLIHIARSPKPNITNKTYYIKLTDYRFVSLPNIISGIELKITSKRLGRVVDDTVILTYNNQPLGNNQASLDINPIKIYGGETILWGNGSITSTMIQDPSFGVILRFKSHPQWPHRSPMSLDSAEMRIH